MPSMNDDLRGALRTFIQLLDQELYYEAHEVLEEAWHYLKSIDDPRVKLIRSMINGAIAFAHIKRQKRHAHKAAHKTWQGYLRNRELANDNTLQDGELIRLACGKLDVLRDKYNPFFKDGA